jgi:two-component system, sensor histidine kinase and response regulator
MNAMKNTTEQSGQIINSNKELEAFIYNASHDLKGPLASSKGLVDLALGSNDPDEIREYLELINTSLGKLDSILVALHEVALIRHGKPFFKKLELPDILSELLNNFKGYPNFKNVKFNIINEFNSDFYSDEILIQVIMRNLIENGIKYAKPGIPDSFVNILMKESADGLLIEISDNGIGIPNEHHEKIFDSFFRASEISSGSGLGLYIVKNAIGKLNGNITIGRSEINNGTLFQLFLPCNLSTMALKLI